MPGIKTELGIMFISLLEKLHYTDNHTTSNYETIIEFCGSLWLSASL